MAEVVYLIGTLTSMVCAALLLRNYRQSRSSLLLWSGLCFIALAANNVLLLLDLYAVRDFSLALARSTTALVGLLLLLFGLSWNIRT